MPSESLGRKIAEKIGRLGEEIRPPVLRFELIEEGLATASC